MVSIVIVNSFLNTIAVLFVAIGIVFALVLYKRTKRQSAAVSIVSMIVFLGLQVLFILAFLVFGSQIGYLYTRDQALTAILIPALRTTAISMLLFSIASTAVGIAVKRKSFLLILLIDLAIFVLSLIVMYISAYVLQWGISGIAIGLGIMQPVSALLPNVGDWSFGNDMQKAVPTSTDIQAGEGDSSNTVTQMFCPKCGTRFSAEKKYCDQCGTGLSVLLRPDAGVPHPSNNIAQDAPSAGFAVLCFFIPLVGLILFLVWHDTYPLRAKSAGKGALAGVIAGVLLSVLLVVIQIALLSSLF